MSFCANCGRPLQDGEVCNCQNATNNIYAPSKPDNSKTIGKGLAVMGAGLVAGVVVIVLVFSAVFGGGYKKPIKDYVKAINNHDTKKMLSVTLPKNKIKELEKEMKDSIIDWDAFLDKMDESIEKATEKLEDDYGKNVKFSAKILDKKKVKGDELEEIQEEYEDEYDAEIKKAYKMKVEMTIKGKKDEKTDKVSVYVVKVKGDDWKMYDYDDEINLSDSLDISLF